MRCVKIVKLLLRGNKSKGMILNVTERFRCHSLASGQVRCSGSCVVDLDVFLIWQGCVNRIDVGSIDLLSFTLKEIDNLIIRFNQTFGYNAN